MTSTLTFGGHARGNLSGLLLISRVPQNKYAKKHRIYRGSVLGSFVLCISVALKKRAIRIGYTPKARLLSDLFNRAPKISKLKPRPKKN